MTWKTTHSRAEVLREVIRAADERRDAVLPMDVPGVTETFADEITLLGALHLRWYTSLSSRIDNALGKEPLDLEVAIAKAWQDTAEALPGIRLILDRYVAEPTSPEMAAIMTRASGKEHAMLALAAGRAGDDWSASVRAGELISSLARASNPTFEPRMQRGSDSLVGRIRAVLAA